MVSLSTFYQWDHRISARVYISLRTIMQDPRCITRLTRTIRVTLMNREFRSESFPHDLCSDVYGVRGAQNFIAFLINEIVWNYKKRVRVERRKFWVAEPERIRTRVIFGGTVSADESRSIREERISIGFLLVARCRFLLVRKGQGQGICRHVKGRSFEKWMKIVRRVPGENLAFSRVKNFVRSWIFWIKLGIIFA